MIVKTNGELVTAVPLSGPGVIRNPPRQGLSTVNLVQFVERYRGAVGALRDRLGEDVREDLLVYLDTGEEGLAVEFLMGNLIRRRIPVTPEEAATLTDLMTYFRPEDGDAEDSFYAALNDPAGAVAELTVVDELPP